MEESDDLRGVLERQKFEYKNYRCLWIQELWAIDDYIDRNDRQPLAELIRNNAPLSDGMREFLADYVAGDITRPPRKEPCLFYRNFDIYHAIIDLMGPGVTRDGAITALEDSKRYTTHKGRNPLKFEALLKIYKRYGK